MREQTTPEHPSQAHERAAFASSAFVTSTAADDLAIQAEDRIPKRENSRIQMVPCSVEHIHQPLSLRCGQLYSIRIQRHSQRVSCQNFQHLSHFWPQARVPGRTTGQRGTSLVPELLVKHRLTAHWRGSERFNEKVIKVKADVAAVLVFVRYWVKLSWAQRVS